MRQFSVTAFLLIAAAVSGIAYGIWPSEESRKAELGAVARAGKGDRLLMPQETAAAIDPKAVNAQAWRAQVVSEYEAIEEGVGRIERRPGPVVVADAEEIAPAHIPASAPAEQVVSEIGKLSLFDLKSATQRELARLGCYEARVDGLWGRKSRAAIERFNEATEGSWEANPGPDLLQTLKGAPDSLCTSGCAAEGTQGERCVAQSTDDSSAGTAQKKRAYLPPWMRGEDVASVSDDVTVVQGGSEHTAATASLEEHSVEPRSRNVRRSYQSRSARDQNRRSSRGWLPDSWPGSGR